MFSATLLLVLSVFLSRIIGFVREKIIAYIFGAGGQTDSYRAAFQLPDMLNYFLVGGVASVVFVSILGRYREQGREDEGEKALSAILSMMLVVLSTGIVLAEVFARSYVAYFFRGFSPDKIALTTEMTRILLPAQLFFFSGGVLASVLIVRKQFAYQALSPLIYNIFIIIGVLLLAGRIGVSSLAVGALVGAFLGFLVLNYVGVRQLGVQLRLTLNWKHSGLYEWVRLSLPLMLGVSLVTADTWIINHFAAHATGEIALLNFAKTLFTAPMAVLGQAAGAASMPFFAALIGQGKHQEFAAQVNSSVTRLIAISFLGSAAMIGLARPIVDVLLRGGALHEADAVMIAKYLSIFSVSLFLWSSQSIYARAFYAAGNTFTPMVAGTVILLLSLPLYWELYHLQGATGLVIASDTGILAQTLAMAVLLNTGGLVRLSGLGWMEMGRALVAALVAGGVLVAFVYGVPQLAGFVGALIQLIVGTVLWVSCCYGVLQVTGSRLPEEIKGRIFGRKKLA